MLSINCPSGPVQPQSQVVVTGSTPDCDTTSREVTVDGQDLAHSWSCTNGDFTITCTAPACSETGMNVIRFKVTQGGNSENCSVDIDCP